MSKELTRDQLSARLDTLENKAIRLDRYANLDSNSMPHLCEMERERNAAKEVIMAHDALQRATIQQQAARVKELEGIIAECVRLVRCGMPDDVEKYAKP